MNRAFTLIELSIVLIIVGLLLGAITGGQRLIANARMQAQVVQIEELRTIVDAFRERYLAWPGDLPVGVALGLQDNNGDGDNQLDLLAERQEFFLALTNAELTNQRYAAGEYAQTTIGNEADISPLYIPDIDRNVLGFSLTPAAAIGRGLTGRQSFQLDELIDDGLPHTGNILSFSGFEWTYTGDADDYFAGTGSASNCVNSNFGTTGATNSYNRDNTADDCAILLVLPN